MAGDVIKNFTSLRVQIESRKFDIPNNHLISLNVNRVMGDSANAFTLEMFDETAMDIELFLMGFGNDFPNIDVYYRGTPDDPEQHFTGTIYNYTPSFVGQSMMLSITGYLGSSDGYGLVAKSSVTWVKPAEPFKTKFEDETDDKGNKIGTKIKKDATGGNDTYMLAWLRDKNTKEDIGLEWNAQQEAWELPAKYNPDDIETYTYTDDWKKKNPKHPDEYLAKHESHRTIIHKNEDGEYDTLKYANFPLVYVVDELMEGYEQSTATTSMVEYGPATSSQSVKQINVLRTRPVISQQRVKPSEVFKRVVSRMKENKDLGISLGDVEDTCWIYYADWSQTYQTPYEYIENVLCNRAIGKDGNAGFYFYVDDNGKANFKQMGYYKGKTKSVNVEYGKKDSNVISFTTSIKGATAMLGAVYDEEGNQSTDTDVLDEFTGQEITDNNLKGYTSTNIQGETSSTSSNKYVPRTINYSSTLDNISAVNKWVKVSNLVTKSELKIWGTTQSGYGPGDYIQVNVMGRKGLHYTTGLYWIIKQTDNISKGGFIKTMTLIKTGNTQSETTNINARLACLSYGLTDAELYEQYIKSYTTDEDCHAQIKTNASVQSEADILNGMMQAAKNADDGSGSALNQIAIQNAVKNYVNEGKGNLGTLTPLTDLDNVVLYDTLEEAQAAAKKSGGGGGR